MTLTRDFSEVNRYRYYQANAVSMIPNGSRATLGSRPKYDCVNDRSVERLPRARFIRRECLRYYDREGSVERKRFTYITVFVPNTSDLVSYFSILESLEAGPKMLLRSIYVLQWFTKPLG